MVEILLSVQASCHGHTKHLNDDWNFIWNVQTIYFRLWYTSQWSHNWLFTRVPISNFWFQSLWSVIIFFVVTCTEISFLCCHFIFFYNSWRSHTWMSYYIYWHWDFIFYSKFECRVDQYLIRVQDLRRWEMSMMREFPTEGHLWRSTYCDLFCMFLQLVSVICTMFFV